MAVKILSRSGSSLADIYNVSGSRVGVEVLEPREVTLVHEMGATIFSERLSGFIRRVVTPAMLQSVTFDVVLGDLPAGIYRVLGITVLVDNLARIDFLQVSLRDPGAGRELPLFVWDSADDSTRGVRIVENGGASASKGLLVPGLTQLPSLGVSAGQVQQVNEIAFRGTTLAFGAGNVIATALIYVAFSQINEFSPRGLPVPGW